MPVHYTFDSFAKGIMKRAQEVGLGESLLLQRIGRVTAHTVIRATPVKTGRAALNWKVAQRVARGGYVQPRYGPDATIRDALMRTARSAASFSRGRGPVILYNNAPYIQQLNEKYYVGFIELAIARARRELLKTRVFARG